MSKGSGGTRATNSKSSHGGGGKHTGPGYTEPISGPKVASSPATEIQYVYVDKITGNHSDGYASLKAVKKGVQRAEREDKRSGVYESDSYYLERIEQLKGRGRSKRYITG